MRPVPAPAKVNLALAVTGRRPDGFHTLRSVFLRLDLHDDLAVRRRPEAGPGDELRVEGQDDCPVAENLVLRAAASLRELVAAPLPGLAFELRKRIPVAAGLAGGSSDAAAALDLAASAWGLRLHPAERLQAALRLGADVPFFAAGHAAALVGGIGEGLVPLPAPDPPAGILLVTPRQRLSTARAFAALDARGALRSAASAQVSRLADELRSGLDGPGLAGRSGELRDGNDLWDAAHEVVPELGRLRAGLEAALGRPFLLSGSGTTLFSILPDPAAAEEAAARLTARALPELDGAVIIATAGATGGTDEGRAGGG